MKKQVSSFILCLCLLMVATSVFPINAMAASTSFSATAAQVYRQFVLDEKYRSYGEGYGSNQYYPVTFALHDMDGNGTPELLVSNGSEDEAGAMHYVFTCNNGEVTYLGTAGSRHGHFQIPAGGAYPGLFWQNGNMGYYPGYYYYLENGRLQKEYVLLEEEIPYEVKVTQETKDDALFHACKNASEHLDEYNLPAIRNMGWDAFVSIYAAEDTPVVNVTVNGVPVQWTDAAPFIDDNNRTMVPLRAVADALGLTVKWDGNAREAIFTNDLKTIYFPIGSTTARTSDGRSIQMDTAAVIVNDRTYAPVRYLAEYFGFIVGWDGNTHTVSISYSNEASNGNTLTFDMRKLEGTWVYYDSNNNKTEWSFDSNGIIKISGEEYGTYRLTTNSSGSEILKIKTTDFDMDFEISDIFMRFILGDASSDQLRAMLQSDGNTGYIYIEDDLLYLFSFQRMVLCSVEKLQKVNTDSIVGTWIVSNPASCLIINADGSYEQRQGEAVNRGTYIMNQNTIQFSNMKTAIYTTSDYPDEIFTTPFTYLVEGNHLILTTGGESAHLFRK